MSSSIDPAAREHGALAPALLQARPEPGAPPPGSPAAPATAAASPPADAPFAGSDAPPPGTGVPARTGSAHSPFAAGATPRGSRRERAIAVETQGLGLVKVRRVSLGGIARCADRLRAAGTPGTTTDDALVDALIEEVLTLGDGSRRRPGAEHLGRLTDDDRRSIAAAVLTLEGVKAAGEGVLQDPLVSLVKRYGPVVGVGDRAPRVPAAIALMADPPSGDDAPSPSSDEFSLPGHAEAASLSQAPEPQIPLFDSGELPPPEPRLPADDAAMPPSRAARAAAEQSRAQLQQLLDAQHHSLIDVSDGQRALAAEVEALTARIEQADAGARRLRLFAAASAGAAAVALALMVAQTVVDARTERRLADEQRALRAELKQQAETLKETQAALARAERALSARGAPRPSQPAAAPPARATRRP